jgi:hypothetical protein
MDDVCSHIVIFVSSLLFFLVSLLLASLVELVHGKKELSPEYTIDRMAIMSPLWVKLNRVSFWWHLGNPF